MTENREKDSHHERLWQLAFGIRPEEELYDCIKDPEQLINVADDPAYAEMKKRLSTLLMDNLKITGDPRVLGSGDEFDAYPYFGGAPKHPSLSN